MIRSVLLLLLFYATTPAVDSGPVRVLAVTDGDTIQVAAHLGDAAFPVRVRLLWVDTPESRGNAHGSAMAEGVQASAALKDLIAVGDQVLLWGPAEAFETDTYGRVLAVVTTNSGVVVNEQLIRAGWTPYWRKYGEAPEPWNQRFIAAEAAAMSNQTGAWSTARDWMTNKRNERTASAQKP